MSYLLPWFFYLPLIAFGAALPFSLALSRRVAGALAIVNFLAPLTFYTLGDSVWLQTLTGITFQSGPLQLQLDAWTLPFLLLIKLAALLALKQPSVRLGRTQLACLFGADFALSGALFSTDVFAIVFFSQLALVPLSLLIVIWGGHDRLFASRKFFLSQTAGCLLWLVALAIRASTHESQFGYPSGLPADLAKALGPAELTAFVCFLLGCFLRSAVFPLHSWLPDTLAQAPLSASLLIVGGLLPSGILLLQRVGLSVFPAGFERAQNLGTALAVFGAIYSGLLAWRQNDSRRYLAFAASLLMSFVLGGVLMAGPLTWTASAFLLCAGSLASLGVLILFEWAFERQNSRQLPDWAGLGQQSPLFRGFLVFLTLSALTLPGTAAFPGTFALLTAAINRNFIWCVGWLASLFLLMASAVRLLGTISFGTPRRGPLVAGSDLSTSESLRLLALSLLLLALGCAPGGFLASLERPIESFWEASPAKERFVFPGDEGKSTLPRVFHRDEVPQ